MALRSEATEAERRQDLLEVAGTSLSLISDHLLTTITNIVSTAEARTGDQGGWTVRFGDAQLAFTGAKEADPSAWHTGTMAPFDVIASAVIQLKVPQNRIGYEGHSHSLCYSDAQASERYQWFGSRSPACSPALHTPSHGHAPHGPRSPTPHVLVKAEVGVQPFPEPHWQSALPLVRRRPDPAPRSPGSWCRAPFR